MNSAASTEVLNIGGSGVSCGGTLAVTGAVTAPSLTLSKNIYMNNQIQNKMLALYDGGTSTDSTMHNYIGLGNSTQVFRFQCMDTITDFVFYAATSATASNEVFRIKGNGAVSCGGTLTTGAITAPSLTLATGTLSYYEEYTHTTSFTGPATSGNMDILITRVGRMVNCYPVLTLSASATSSGVSQWTSSVALPARFIPRTWISTNVMGANNGYATTIVVSCDSATGKISYAAYPAGAWMGNMVVYQWNMTWSV